MQGPHTYRQLGPLPASKSPPHPPPPASRIPDQGLPGFLLKRKTKELVSLYVTFKVNRECPKVIEPHGELRRGDFRAGNLLRDHSVLAQSLHSTNEETETRISISPRITP